MNATPATVAQQVRFAQRRNRQTPVYTTVSGQTSTVPRKPSPRHCADVREFGTHVLTDVIADLPGDRSVGYCSCGKYMDTGTFDERNA